MSEKINKILIAFLSVLVTGVLVSGYFLYFDKGGSPKTSVIPAQEAGKKAIDFINSNALPPGTSASLLQVTEEDSVYKIDLEIEGQEYESFITKDGRFIFPTGYDLAENIENSDNQTAANQEIEKTEMPDVKLFVMSYCPYGLQAQKMYVPVYELLGDKAEMGVYFVNYIMHDKVEIDENLNQYCIQKEQEEKYTEYLSCFAEEGDTEGCMTSAGIDQPKVQDCISATDQEYSIYSQYEDKSTWLNETFPRFDIHSDLNDEYGVQGSPTVVINGQIAQLPSRSPESFKKVVCDAFVSPPEECSQSLSDMPFTPGFGLEQGQTSGGGCGT
ncbi:MAG: hypothetical protein GF370_04235 [Candidatus Nealsonbacteria bacterium]|nr:hypothetical protein [Candidatus Nealsonbacteria bacterium]